MVKLHLSLRFYSFHLPYDAIRHLHPSNHF